jgi:transmembrane sensor
MPEPSFSASELAQNELFIAWVLRPTPALDAHWQAVVAQSAQQARAIAQGQAMVLFLHQPEAVAAGQVDADWLRLQTALAEQPNEARAMPFTVQRTQPSVFRPVRWWAAASVALLLLAGGLWWRSVAFRDTYLTTRPGQTRVVDLPDGSRVTLNAASQLRTQTDGWGRFSREVWLTGEAFFEIQKTTDRRQFVVHTAQTNVAVLGTKFNVLARRQRTNVVLQEGRVRLETPTAPALMLTPGDWVQVADRQTTRRRVRAEDYRAWTTNRLVFEAVPVAEVLQTLEDRYGFRIQLANPTIGQRTYTGILPILPDGRVLLRAVAETYDLRVQSQTDSTYLLQP